MGVNIERLKEIAVPRSKEAIQSARERKLKRLMKKKYERTTFASTGQSIEGTRHAYSHDRVIPF
jgi:hypothetical protein